MGLTVAREIMISAIADLVINDRHVAVGAASPVPAAGVMLARHLNGGRTRLSLLGSRAHTPFTDGGRELFDCAAQGRIDVFFLSGAQIDGDANVNLLGTGSADRLERRFSGNFGAPFMTYTVPKIILFREPHTAKTLVNRVDYVSAAGRSDPGVWRRGGPKHLVTDRCVFDFDGDRFELRSIHEGQTEAVIKENTGFHYASADNRPVSKTPAPCTERLALIRGPVLEALRETYPAFVGAGD